MNFKQNHHSADTAEPRHEKSMKPEPNSVAAETVQTTNVPAVELLRLARQSITPREAFEHATWKYANETYPNSCPSILFDAGELGICLLQWSGSCGGRWRNVWFDRLYSLPNDLRQPPLPADSNTTPKDAAR